MKNLLLFLALPFLFNCTEQDRARSYGGTADISVQCGQKVVTATWKETHLWVLTRPMKLDENPEIFTFSESSSWGMMQGTVILTESLCQQALK